MPDQKIITIRLDHSLWVSLRRLEESGQIKSIQDGVVRALYLLLGKSEKGE